MAMGTGESSQHCFRSHSRGLSLTTFSRAKSMTPCSVNSKGAWGINGGFEYTQQLVQKNRTRQWVTIEYPVYPFS